MRQGQQNRRGRGRNNSNNNNRKSHNPLGRSFESNGPDVKIRGTPAHIAEKYLTLARDAQTSGDPVLAENYLQHAEHYTRIIMAYRDQLHQPGELPNGNSQRAAGDGGDEFGDDESEDILDEGYQAPPPHQQGPGQGLGQGHQQQGRQGGQNEGYRNDRPYRRDQGQGRFRDRERHGGDRDRPDKPQGDRPQGDRPQGDRPQAEGRPPQQERQQQEPAAEAGGEPRRRDRFPQQAHEQPDFLRRPVRRARVESEDTPPPGKDEPSRD